MILPLCTDPSVMFQTSLACGRLLLQVPGGVVVEMMQCNRILMAIATLMYAPSPLEEVRLCVLKVNRLWPRIASYPGRRRETAWYQLCAHVRMDILRQKYAMKYSHVVEKSAV